MSLKQYRAMDLISFALILIVSQLVISFAASRWFADQLYIVSPVAAVTAIVMMRWGSFAGIHAVVGGAALCLFLGGSCKHLLIYCIGNLLSLAALHMLKKLGKQSVQTVTGQALGFAALIQALMWLGRAVLALVLYGFDWQAAVGFVTTDSLSMVFTLVLIWIARRVDGLFEDQLYYLRRVQKEDTEEQTKGGERT